MPLARELRRGRILQRRLMEKRNAEALAEEAARQSALSGGVKMERTGAPENKMQPAPENKVEEVHKAAKPFSPLIYAEAVVPFASDRARELAAEFGLGASYFAGQPYSGHSGFTAADVRRIAESRP